jgi:hypothetical protein
MRLFGLHTLTTTLQLSPYKLAVMIFNRYSNKDELLSSLNENSVYNPLSRFFVEFLLYFKNIPLSDEFQIFFAH